MYNILICDDDKDIVNALKIYLTDPQYRLLEAYNGLEALELAEENRRRLGAWNLRLIAGVAPEALTGLPTPDAVFIGGSGGRLEEILRAVGTAAPSARICLSAVTPESVAAALRVLPELDYETEVCQIAVSRGCRKGESTLMLAQNPIWLITGTQK